MCVDTVQEREIISPPLACGLDVACHFQSIGYGQDNEKHLTRKTWDTRPEQCPWVTLPTMTHVHIMSRT